MKPDFKVLEVSGIVPAIMSMRLPTGSKNDSEFIPYFSKNGYTLGSDINLGQKDSKLATNLVKKGNVHGKYQRLIDVYALVTMPRYIWSELDTYRVGVETGSSTSTMYTAKKEMLGFEESFKNNTFDKNLMNHFEDGTEDVVGEAFTMVMHKYIQMYGSIKNIPKTVLKRAIPDTWMQTRGKKFSYQALKGIYIYRKNHDLETWKIICNAIEKLPYVEELMFGCTIKEIKCD